MAEGLLVTYLIGLVATAIILSTAIRRLPGEESRQLNPAVGVLLIFIWPIFWILVGLAARSGKF